MTDTLTSELRQPAGLAPRGGSLPVYYEDANVTIYHADCLDVLRHLPKV